MVTIRRASSFFILGLMMGVLVCTVTFALIVWHQKIGINGSGQGVIVLRLGHGLDTRHPVHAGMVHMARRLDELSSGQVRLQIYPNKHTAAHRRLRHHQRAKDHI